ncbi:MULTISPECIES: hypothetical protein [unclassified Methanosarcina]|uniref:hypothetical protein n=1 Tax=unclassified Methanosarcina TaxID=2644672 RepID=UPI0025EB0F2D|nr:MULTISPECIES: hypothetical protein [unclassified Methanosarcina]
MFKYIIQFYNMKGLTKCPLKQGLVYLISNFEKVKFNPLYWFTLPGSILWSGGLYIGFCLLRTYSLGESLAFGPTVLMVMSSFIGMGMTFTGILLHSISGLLRHLHE